MTIFVENETDYVFPFDPEKVAGQVVLEVLEEESCPYETEVNILITDNEGIRLYNREYRNIDRETDVLSFPNVPFEAPADFNAAEQYEADCFQPDSGELILGDIILSRDRILEQAESFGHSIRREFAFLVAHSMLHLCGYDHMEPQEAAVMEKNRTMSWTCWELREILPTDDGNCPATVPLSELLTLCLMHKIKTTNKNDK